ncbi:MAG: hypothetical protein HYT64_00820 [Candidatus Yanofskybacteria bacterium]|nr:hypothetical protein [Candidatus Yanofskybacteria bacterium]
MRNIINISLPEAMAKMVEKEVQRGRFASTSEYIRYLIRSNELMSDIEQSRKEFAEGKGKLLKSLKELD